MYVCVCVCACVHIYIPIYNGLTPSLHPSVVCSGGYALWRTRGPHGLAPRIRLELTPVDPVTISMIIRPIR